MAKAKTAAENTGTELAVLGDGGRDSENRITTLDYALTNLTMGAAEDVAEAIAANIGTTKISAFDFDRIKVPAGGGTAWEVIDPDTGETEPAKYVEGVIVAFRDQKAFWKRGLDEQGAVQGPPDCYSPDTIHGIGTPGMACARCPHNVFGTAKGGAGRGKACKDTRHIYFCGKDDVLPRLVSIPPTSLKGMKRYFLNLAGRAVPHWQAITRLKLVKDKNSAGIEYAKVEPSLVAILAGDAKAATKSFGVTMRQMLGEVVAPVIPDDVYRGSDESPLQPVPTGDPNEIIEGRLADDNSI